MKDGALRARGLKKDPQEYLTVNGVLYPGTEETLRPAKELLGDRYQLNDDLILQSLTHKSFAHGKKPYNEKLAILGKELLRLEASFFAVSQQSSGSNGSRVGHANFDISPNTLEVLCSVTAIAEVSKRAGIANSIFWKKRAEIAAEKSGEITVQAKSIVALIGAILVTQGQAKACDFIRTKLLSGPFSLVDIAQSIYLPTDSSRGSQELR